MCRMGTGISGGFIEWNVQMPVEGLSAKIPLLPFPLAVGSPSDNPHRVVSNRARLNPVQAIPPSSVILHTDESDNLPEAKKRSGPGSASKSCDAT
ncbi:hypothetical protein CRG98_031132, partial [Punica granatum]